jgi:Family of unknown function (DUF5652)
MNQTLIDNQTLIWLIALLALWEIVWKAIGLWKTGRNNQPVWFIAILIFNTLGILPIVYLVFFQKNKRGSK